MGLVSLLSILFLILKHGVKKTTVTVTQIAQFYVQSTAVSAASPPVVRRLFEVNSEPHTGARPSVRLCVGLITPISREWHKSPTDRTICVRFFGAARRRDTESFSGIESFYGMLGRGAQKKKVKVTFR